MGRTANTLEDILDNFAFTDEGCWEWQGAIGPAGYGQASVDYKHINAVHRYIYENMIDEIPTGKHVHHICRNKRCASPYHMQLVTQAEHNAIHKEEDSFN